MSAESKLLPCPFCGSGNVDASGWMSTNDSGPACDDCSGSAESVERWNSRPAPKGETWDDMTTRHALEKAEAVMALSEQGLTQTEAAKVLGMSLTQLSNYLTRNDLTWRVVRQGFASRDPESLSPYGVNNPPAGERMQ